MFGHEINLPTFNWIDHQNIHTEAYTKMETELWIDINIPAAAAGSEKTQEIYII